MKIDNNIMAEAVRRNVSSSPQNQAQIAASHSVTSSSTNTGGAQPQQQQQSSSSATRLQQLKQRKLELDKLLNEKINLLHQLCKQESQLGILKNGFDSDALLNNIAPSVVDENLNFFGRASPKEETTKELLAVHQLQSHDKTINSTATHSTARKTQPGNQKQVNHSVSQIKKRQNQDQHGEYNNNNNNSKSPNIPPYPANLIGTTGSIPIPMERRNSLLSKNASQTANASGKYQQMPTTRSEIFDTDYIGLLDTHQKSKTMPYHYHPSTQNFYHNSRDSGPFLGNNHYTYHHRIESTKKNMRSPEIEYPIFDGPLSPTQHPNHTRFVRDDTIIVSYGNFNDYPSSRHDSTRNSTINEQLHLNYHTPQPEYFYHHTTTTTSTKQTADPRTHSPVHISRKYHSQQQQRILYKKSHSHNDVHDDDADADNADVVSLAPSILQQQQQQHLTTTIHQQPILMIPEQTQQGLGGYWHTLDNNERVWCTVDSRFASLDRKGQQKLLQKQHNTDVQNPPPKSISLGNIDLVAKHDKQFDSISISSVNAESKKPKEKQWVETPLDVPLAKYKQPNLPPKNLQSQSYAQHHHDNISVIISPSSSTTTLSSANYLREKKKLSSQSMHSPSGRSGSVGAIEKKSLLTPALLVYNSMSNPMQVPSTSSSSDYAQIDNYYDGNSVLSHHQQLLLSATPISPVHLRRTASCVSSTSIVSGTPTHHTQASPSTINDFNINNTNAFNSIIKGPIDIRTESPKNMTVIQQAKFQPYKEVTKPFEMSDFYKYSTKFRQKSTTTITNSVNSNSNNNNLATNSSS